METIIKDEIMAFVPIYVEGKGNCTKVYTKYNEPEILEKNLKSVVRNLCKFYMIDLNETRRRYKSLLSSPNLVPLPFSKRDIFIPLRTRKPLLKNDGATGYFNMKHIKKITDNKASTFIHLENNVQIEALCNKFTVKSHLKDGTIVSRCFEERTMIAAENEVSYDGKRPIIIVYEK
ncbi:competence protein ComK [Tissierella sp. Yu-01]|uniref:competence protein ComK n=1 Tax=Tissierella sp. Yu-01 TaxID=3035694 RepID=UPI00240D2D5F|nr:competence protein ComK [Tissierella sp. Yu-01]WFA08580.1 competence protein ComK [Tissierella sp. Yu-01]